MFAPGAGRFLGPMAAGLVVFVVLGALGGADSLALVLPFLLLFGGLLAFFAVFFRDPERVPGIEIVSAADGRVQAVREEGGRLAISVFMNVTNVHVNRFPLAGTVESISNAGEGYRPAYAVDAVHNVRRSYRLATAIGPVEVVQITGILARRLVSFVREGDRAEKGDRLGMIVLGSRVDVYLPADRVVPVVEAGARVSAGTTTIARERP